MALDNNDDLPFVSGEHARAVGRICTEFFLNTAVDSADFFKGELVTALVFLAIMRENVRHLDHELTQAKGQTPLRSPVPDSDREPVTIYVVAKVLGLTYETARRHVKRLVDGGYCVRMERGLLVPAEVLTRPDVMRANARNLFHFNQLLNDAMRAGLIEITANVD